MFEASSATPVAVVQQVSVASGEEQTYGYCTEFLVSGNKLNADTMREELGLLGDSLLVVGDDRLVRVHVHTFDPGKAIGVGTRAGILRQVKVDNMQLQHEDWKERHGEAAPLADGVSVVAVASGDGFAKLFKSLGVHEIVAGGQTMNPSAQDLVNAIDRTGTRDVVLLPNNDNIVLTARQAAGMSSRNVGVVPTSTLPQGIAAALAMQLESSVEDNVAGMTEAAGAVDTGEVTTAVRDATFDGFRIAEGQSIGLLNGRVVSVGDSVEEAFWALLAKMSPETAEILSLYYGSECSADEAEQLAERIRERYSGAEVEVVDGGQPFYRFILSRE